MTSWLLMAVAAFVAGILNAVAGGGSLISFPALLHTGMPSVVANATNTVAMWPGSIASLWPYKEIISRERHRATVLAIPSLLGGLAGSVLLLHTPQNAFDAVVPWLILFACALLTLQAPVARWIATGRGGESRRVPAPLWVAQFCIAVYGGYFGAGIGILMLAGMAIFIPQSIQAANGLKILFATAINGIAALYFLAARAARLREAAFMAVCAIVGGFLGSHIAQRLPAKLLRGVVVAYGTLFALKLLLWK